MTWWLWGGGALLSATSTFLGVVLISPAVAFVAYGVMLGTVAMVVAQP